MIRNDINILIGVKKATMRIAAGCLLLFFMAGSAIAQSGQFVIKKKYQEGDATAHYLAHVKVGENWVLRDVTTFIPDSCLWISNNRYTQGGTNKNYYFYDYEDPEHPVAKFLGAPEFEAGGRLVLSDTVPPTSYLNNPEYQYYFYKWDNGLGRGVQYHGVTSEWCNNNHPGGWNTSNECWEVYWVSYNSATDTWKLSEEHYDLADVPYGAKYHAVSITEHAVEITATEANPGLEDLEDFVMEYNASPLTTHTVTPTINDYEYSTRPAYTTYVFDGGTHNYYDAGSGAMDQGENTPTALLSDLNLASQATCSWSLSGEGAVYLSINDDDPTSPIITYSTQNTEVHKTATLTLTVTYHDGSTQTSTANILVKANCHNPTVNTPEVTNLGATVTWTPTAETYVVSWKKDATGAAWQSATVSNATSYTITGLDFASTYYYKVRATCDSEPAEPYPTFTTPDDPGLFVSGAVFGGGRVADVGGKTEVVIINCGSIGAVYGGNDIAGSVLGNSGVDGSTITLGVDDGGTYASYGTTTAPINIGSVYGGGNGYYAYNGSSFVPASSDYRSHDVQVNGHVNAMTPEHEVGGVVWTNNGTEPYTMNFPSIVKTDITVTNDYVKVDSIFGGAKNAFLTTNSGNGSSITIDGGTIFAVFGGNNWGGTQGYGIHYIEVNGTTTNLAANINNTPTTGYGRDFGIRYLFGGGNKVAGSSTDIHIEGGQLDEVFAGGNAADVYYANVEVNCELGAHTADSVYGNVYTSAIDLGHYTSGSIDANTLNPDYDWDGVSGIYNVRNLYGGNNEAEMTRVPTVTLTSGSVGTVYGGGNAGDMMGVATSNGSGGELNINGNAVVYGTHVVLNSNKMLVDYLYGGCRMSNVANSTWVELKKGHVGYVYGGCNISGDVGSTRVYDTYAGGATYPTTYEEQKVLGATYVVAGVGSGSNTDLIVYKNLFAGSNGYYNCSGDDNIHYNETPSPDFDDPEGHYVGKEIPTHNETNVIVTQGVTVKGDVYAGGNLAPVGFTDDAGFYRGYPERIGLASVRMDGGIVEQNVYGGGNMASIFGSNEVRVTGGIIRHGLYGGNDRAGQVAEMSNRIFPPIYHHASDSATLIVGEGSLGVKTYVGVSGSANIGTVYGGGNGAYPPGSIHYCYTDDEPVQSNTFVDIHIDGRAIGSGGGHIGTVYGGGNGVTTWDGVTVFLNVKNAVYDRNHVDTIFGGNNMGDLSVVPDIRLIHGQVGTVYGGCNKGAMIAHGNNLVTIDTYDNIGSYVHLLASYPGVDANHQPITVIPDAKVTEAIYGGCCMNNVWGEDELHNHYPTNSLVFVEHGDFSGTLIYGGSDISGHVSNLSQVVVTGGTVGHVYGGGNGGYTYTQNGETYDVSLNGQTIATGVPGAPSSTNSRVDILGGQVGTEDDPTGEVFGGGFGALTETTNNVFVNVGPASATSWTGLPVIYGDVYGGSAFGNVNTLASSSNLYSTYVNFLNGTLHGNLYGGGKGDSENANLAKTFGCILVSISKEDQTQANCFIDLRDANVFGCNNTNGSPQNNVTVEVWKTAYNFIGYTTGEKYTSQYVAPSGETPLYAIDQVFGGGDQANYAPMNGDAINLDKKTSVIIHGCVNTIRRVFSGGNAADASKVAATIQGGRMDYVFGGGNGENNHPANIGAGGTDLEVQAGIINHLFGGSNETGTISGPVLTEVNGTGMGEACAEDIVEFYGGSNQASLGTVESPASVKAVIKCGTGHFDEVYGGSKQASIIGDVRLDIQGGQCDTVYGGSKGVAGNGGAANITGNVTLNLEGGTIYDAFGGSNVNGNITGSITVNVIDFELEDCGLDLTNVYGGGNLTPYTPTTPGSHSPVVNVMNIKQVEGIKGNVYGGAKGATATVTANPQVNFGYISSMSGYLPDNCPSTLDPDDFRAFISDSIYGGGNLAAVNGSIEININKGTIGTSTTSSGIFGGGYGPNTTVSGDVTINYGLDVDSYDDDLHLYGDLYGGSALGSVNTNGSNKTTINVYNGIIDGNLYGGGLGDKASLGTGHANVEAKVFGKVYVKIGKMITHLDTGDEPTFKGWANLNNCSVYGCNNVNGSPKDEVFVDVYSTYRRESDLVDAVGDVTFAILNVFGGGDQADYVPLSTQKTHVYVHGCDNTAEFLYGGGNAADAYGVEIVVEGGRFREAYGGGNGMTVQANIGDGGIGYNFHGGHFGFTYEGSNRNGENSGPVTTPPLMDPGYSVECGGSFTDSHFFGANMAEIYVDVLENIITCEEAEEYHFKNVYAGSRWAIIYGDVKLTVCGGDIENLFGGSQGYRASGNTPGFSADIRKYPYFSDITTDYTEHSSDTTLRKYSYNLRRHMGYIDPGHDGHPGTEPSYVGQGGNITLIVNGGTIGNVIGGCNINGNVEGKITVIVEDAEANTCELHVGDVYGASNEAVYEPTDNDGTDSPRVAIIKGSLGMEHDFNSNGVINAGERFDGNVFGGGNKGNITASPKVIIGDGTTGADATKVTVGGDVYGGGNEGSVTGSTNVVVVPIMHSLTVTNPGSQHIVSVTNSLGDDMNGQNVGEGHVLMMQAISSPYGYRFDHWECDYGTIANRFKAVTTFTMGTADATITAVFASGVTTHKLNYNNPDGGTVQVIDGLGHTVASGAYISVGAVVNIVATPADAVHEFHEWSTTSGTIANLSASTTTFTMGTADATISASFNGVATHTLTFSVPQGNGSFTVKDAQGHSLASPATVGEGAILNLDVDPESITDGYAFVKWTAINATTANEWAPSTTLRMGVGDADLQATFKMTHTFSVTTPVNGTVRVLDGEGNIVNSGASVAEGVTLHLKATPMAGYAFKAWEVTDGDGTITSLNVANTTFTMGTANTTIKATFVLTHTLTLTQPENGTVKITNTIGSQTATVTCPASIGATLQLELKATPAQDYVFKRWIVTGPVDSTVAEPTDATTTFTMGTADTNIQATFEPAPEP